MPADASKEPTANAATMTMSLAARTRMRAHETARYYYYDDGGKPGVGNCTWGIGNLAHRGPCIASELKTKVDPAQVELSFARKVAYAEGAVGRRVPHQALTQAQFDALVSFIFNVGERGGKETLSRVEQGHFDAAARGISQSIKMRVKKEGTLKLVVAHGLIKRRAEESAPFRVPAR